MDQTQKLKFKDWNDQNHAEEEEERDGELCIEDDEHLGDLEQ